MNIREQVDLAPLTYYKIGGPARYLAQPESLEELAQIAAHLRATHLPYFILGAGSNVLFDDAGFDGLVLQTSKLDHTLSQNGNELSVGAGTLVIQVLRHCMLQGLGGFEFLVGVPGSMGGVFFMNAGTNAGEISGAALEVTAFDLATGQSRAIPHDGLKYSYRSQGFLNPHELIVRGRLRGKASDAETVQNKVKLLLTARKHSQPIDKPSCGSVFKNPKSSHAWQLIDQAGLRGHRIGNAQISPMHANFIVNLGGAKAADVKALITEVKETVHARFGVTLEEEARIVPRSGGKHL